jgi:hypothetical protein
VPRTVQTHTAWPLALALCSTHELLDTRGSQHMTQGLDSLNVLLLSTHNSQHTSCSSHDSRLWSCSPHSTRGARLTTHASRAHCTRYSCALQLRFTTHVCGQNPVSILSHRLVTVVHWAPPSPAESHQAMHNKPQSGQWPQDPTTQAQTGANQHIMRIR